MSQMTPPEVNRVEAFIRRHPVALYLAFGLLAFPGMLWVLYPSSQSMQYVGAVVLAISLSFALALMAVSTLNVLRSRG